MYTAVGGDISLSKATTTTATSKTRSRQQYTMQINFKWTFSLAMSIKQVFTRNGKHQVINDSERIIARPYKATTRHAGGAATSVLAGRDRYGPSNSCAANRCRTRHRFPPPRQGVARVPVRLGDVNDHQVMRDLSLAGLHHRLRGHAAVVGHLQSENEGSRVLEDRAEMCRRPPLSSKYDI